MEDELASEWDAHFAGAARRFLAGRATGPPTAVGPRTSRRAQTADMSVRRLTGREIDVWSDRIAGDLRVRAKLGEVDINTAIPIAALAEELGFGIVYHRQVFDGHLPPLERGEIVVRGDSSLERSRFTIAHELGHIWLRLFKTGPAWGSMLDHRSEERLCDRVAANLLLPSEKLACLPPKPDVAALRAMAESAQVSMQVAAGQAVAVRRWRCLLVRWTLRGDKWCVDTQTGGPWRAKGWTLPSDAVAFPMTSPHFTVRVQTPEGPRKAPMQIGAWSRTRLTTLVTGLYASD